MSKVLWKSSIENDEQWKQLGKKMKGEMKYTLMNDFLSKYSLQNDLYALGGLLAALLDIDVESITNITIMNPVEPADTVTEKNCVLDTKLELNHNTIINIEIQMRYQDFWAERSLTYLCRIFDHLKSGDSYESVKPCIQIGILSKDLFKKDDPRYTGEFYSEYKMLNVKTHTDYSSKFAIRVLSLSHIEDVSDEEKKRPNGLYHWAKLFTANSWEDLIDMAEENSRIKSFVGTIQKLSAEEKVQLACENRRRYSNEIATYEGMVKRERERAEQEQARAEQEQARAEQEYARAEQARARADQEHAKNVQLSAEIEELKKQLELARSENK